MKLKIEDKGREDNDELAENIRLIRSEEETKQLTSNIDGVR